jgi:hypothetical protein
MNFQQTWAILALNDIEDNLFSVAKRCNRLFRIELGDRTLVNEDLKLKLFRCLSTVEITSSPETSLREIKP